MDYQPYIDAIKKAIQEHPRREHLEAMFSDDMLRLWTITIDKYAERTGQQFVWDQEGINQMLESQLLATDALTKPGGWR